MKREIKTVVILMLLASNANADNDEKSSDSLLSKAPLQNELSKVYKKSEEVGKKAGKGTKNFFCSELHWTFFCKGED